MPIPDGKLSSSTNATDPWPYGDLDSLTNYSTPAATVYTGGFMNKPITSMRINANGGTASFWYMRAPSPFDVNRDGEVNIGDVNVVIKVIVGEREPFDACDVNKDGEVNIADVNAIIKAILKS